LNELLDQLDVGLAHIAVVEVQVPQVVLKVKPCSLLQHLDNLLLEFEAQRSVHGHAQVLHLRFSLDDLAHQLESTRIIQPGVPQVQHPEIKLVAALDDSAQSVDAEVVDGNAADVELDHSCEWQRLEQVGDRLVGALQPLDGQNHH
jgi:hypothetical protein